MSYKQSTVDDRMLVQLESFVRTGHERDFFNSPNRKELAAHIATWIPKMRSAMNPKEITEDLRLKLAPMLAVFTETHERVACLALLLEAWGRATGKARALESLTGPLWVGEDEAADERHLHDWPHAFAKLFPASALPPYLQPDPVKKQLTAHATARAELPGSTPGQTYNAARKNLTALRAEGLGHWNRMHDLLDGELGTGKNTFETKAAFGYNRRLRGVGASRNKRSGDAPPAIGAPAPGSPATQASAV